MKICMHHTWPLHNGLKLVKPQTHLAWLGRTSCQNKSTIQKLEALPFSPGMMHRCRHLPSLVGLKPLRPRHFVSSVAYGSAVAPPVV